MLTIADRTGTVFRQKEITNLEELGNGVVLLAEQEGLK